MSVNRTTMVLLLCAVLGPTHEVLDPKESAVPMPSLRPNPLASIGATTTAAMMRSKAHSHPSGRWRRMTRTGVALTLTIALATGPGSAVGQPAGTVSVPSGASRYTVCNFADPSSPKANSKYPLAFLLSAKIRRSSDRNVRKAVRSIQEILRAEGYTNRSGQLTVVDGDYGTATSYAVKQFQRRARITVDGKVGPQTWKRLGSTYCWMYH